MPLQIPCVCCDKSFDQSSMIQCSICKSNYKNSCVNVSNTELKLINGKKGFEWSCENCRGFGNDIKALKAIIMELKNDIKQLKEEKCSKSKGFDVEDVISEINERNKRKCNLIFFGIDEQDVDKSADVKANEDKKEVQNIVRALLPDINTDDIKTLRIGHYDVDKCRPIKISLPSEDLVHNVIRHAKNLKKKPKYKNISISFDRTKRQLEHYKDLKSQLSQRIMAGETDYKIKYINGTPKIVKEN